MSTLCEPGTPESERNSIHQHLLSSRDFVEASVFAAARDRVIDKLEKAWIRYLKEDLKTFIESVTPALFHTTANTVITALVCIRQY